MRDLLMPVGIRLERSFGRVEMTLFSLRIREALVSNPRAKPQKESTLVAAVNHAPRSTDIETTAFRGVWSIREQFYE